jgi:uncharacterized protein YciI
MNNQTEKWIRTVLFAMAVLIAGVVVAQTPQGPNIPKGLKQYFIGFLVQGEKWAQTPPKEELDRLMQQHLAYIRSQADAGKYKVAGPFLDNGRIRGFVVVEATSAEEAANIVNGDPIVKSGRMAGEIHPAMMADISCVLMEYEKNRAK